MAKKKTVFEAYHWDFALQCIPENAELVSISNTNSVVEHIGVFYRLPGETSNHYKRYMTKQGKEHAEALQGARN